MRIMKWETRFKELLNYRAENGDCDVPNRQGKLGTWVSTQRDFYKEGRLAQDRIERLDAIGFNWKQKTGFPPWEVRFNDLVRYKARHGHCSPTRQEKLGNWVHNQRSKYKLGELSQDHIDLLDGIGFDWTLPRGDRTDKKKGIKQGPRKANTLTRTRKQSWSRKARVVAKVRGKSDEAEVRATAINGARCKGCNSGHAPSSALPVPPNRSIRNLCTMSEDEDDEIGALIYAIYAASKASPNETAD